MTRMDDWHGLLAWMTGMEADISYIYILITDRLTDGLTDRHWYPLSRYCDWKCLRSCCVPSHSLIIYKCWWLVPLEPPYLGSTVLHSFCFCSFLLISQLHKLERPNTKEIKEAREIEITKIREIKVATDIRKIRVQTDQRDN